MIRKLKLYQNSNCEEKTQIVKMHIIIYQKWQHNYFFGQPQIVKGPKMLQNTDYDYGDITQIVT